MASSPSRRSKSRLRGGRRNNGDPDVSTGSSSRSLSRRRSRHLTHTQSLDSGLSPSHEEGDSVRVRASSLLRAGRDLLGRLGSSSSRDFDDVFMSCDELPAAPSREHERERMFTPRDDEDDSGVEDECMILTDDEDDASETDALFSKSQQSLSDSVSPRASMVQTEKAAYRSMFAEKHPWRRQSFRDSALLRSTKGPKLPSARNLIEDEDDIAYNSFSKTKQDEEASDEEEEDDDSSSASEDDDDMSSVQSTVSIISDPEQDLDLSQLEHISNYFTSQPQVMSSYLDPSLNDISVLDTKVFAYEHSLLLRAIMQLLAERDYIGVEADLDDLSCVVKKGPLKKATHNVGRTTWRVKYVEIRPGSFSYFENVAKRENLGRKTIQLRSNKCSCVSVKGNQFALTVEGVRRLWMANSEEERQAWVRAIEEAMIGPGGAGDSSQPLDLAQYQLALAKFQETQTNLRQAKGQDEYMAVAEKLFGTDIQVPVQWVRDQTNLAQSSRNFDASAHRRMNTSVTGFWKSLRQESVSINGCKISKTSPHAAERVVGALSRCILEFDKSSPIESHAPMSELQAISHAREVLMSVLRSRKKDEAHLSLDYLCKNPDQTIVQPVSGPGEANHTLSLRVSYATGEVTKHPQQTDISGWVSTRSRSIWKNRFVTVSDGILNVFEHSSPRPHGLKGQFLLAGASTMIVDERKSNEASPYILRIVSRNHESERYISFPDEALLKEWKDAIDKSIESSPVPNDDTPMTAMTPRKIVAEGKRSSAKIIKGATGQLIKATDKATDMIRSIRPQSKSSDSPSDNDLFRSSTQSESVALTASSFESEPLFAKYWHETTVQIMAESVSVYKITNVTGDDVLITVRTTMCHPFLLSGGRLTKGDELVEMDFYRGELSEDQLNALEHHLSP